jgi:hypothetical protein
MMNHSGRKRARDGRGLPVHPAPRPGVSWLPVWMRMAGGSVQLAPGVSLLLTRVDRPLMEPLSRATHAGQSYSRLT